MRLRGKERRRVTFADDVQTLSVDGRRSRESVNHAPSVLRAPRPWCATRPGKTGAPTPVPGTEPVTVAPAAVLGRVAVTPAVMTAAGMGAAVAVTSVTIGRVTETLAAVMTMATVTETLLVTVAGSAEGARGDALGKIVLEPFL